MEGVAADGVARVVLRIPAAEANEPFMLTLLNDSGNASLSVDEDGGLTLPGEDRSGAANTLFVSAQETPAGPTAFAVYHSPIDFPRPDGRDAAAGERTVAIRVQSLDSSGNPLDVPVKIVRPPVFLVHGIWSNPGAWAFFRPLVPDLSQRFFVATISYQETNDQGFEANALVVLPRAQELLNQFKSLKNVAAVQYDAVTHSMGGNIIRALVLSGQFVQDGNYARGDVHKLITIGTPHLGTQFANRLLHSSAFCQSVFAGLEMPVADGVRDMAVGSAALSAINQTTVHGLLTHTVVGIANSEQVAAAQSGFAASVGRRVCPSLFPPGGSTGVLGEPSDLIVAVRSQSAQGLVLLGGDPPSSSFAPIIHAVDPKLFRLGPDELSRIVEGGQRTFAPTGIPERVIDLLNRNLSDATDFKAIRP